MKKKVIISGILLIVNFVYAQNDEYSKLIKKADSLYTVKDYKNSATVYSQAFKINEWKGTSHDRYNAACSWAMANVPDSAFFNLERIVSKSNYSNYDHIIEDGDLKGLYNDKRWNLLIELVKQNKEKAEANLNKPLMNQLFEIHNDDQAYRIQEQEFATKHGWDSKEVKDIWKIIRVKDSLNLIKVEVILDKYGWVGQDIVGGEGNSTLFLIIQHSDLKTQEKYLPMMREAVRNNNARAADLALLEDRIEIRNGRKQVYGSQIGRFKDTQINFVSALIDPDNVDKRRASVGLSTLAEYVSYWDLKWDVEQYKKDLPKIEATQQKY